MNPTAADPHQLRNLADERKHQAVLERMWHGRQIAEQAEDGTQQWVMLLRDPGFGV